MRRNSRRKVRNPHPIDYSLSDVLSNSLVRRSHFVRERFAAINENNNVLKVLAAEEVAFTSVGERVQLAR